MLEQGFSLFDNTVFISQKSSQQLCLWTVFLGKCNQQFFLFGKHEIINLKMFLKITIPIFTYNIQEYLHLLMEITPNKQWWREMIGGEVYGSPEANNQNLVLQLK